MSAQRPQFRGGRNVALKLPARDYPETLRFYRDILGLPVVHEGASGAVVEFGPIRLWLDRVPQQSQPDVWLELVVDDSPAAEAFLKARGIARCDEVEKLPDGFDGFWIAAPAGTIHLVAGDSG